ncbi:hypothetical protein [Anthocerotibacter panamensis]|uniref:hypothetical protein n=1 Tax=Anthocerotibacter panamensis TaxID=2857077 RepID=UPI001C4085FD|nr:hypothetical protein [Anthocerotibacter panamensis]
MGQIVNFQKTKALLMEMTLDLDREHQVNLGVGDEDDEFLLLLQGERMVAAQVADDELWELCTLYQRARGWVELDLIAGALPYKTLELAGEKGAGVALTCSAASLVGVQIIIHGGATVLAVEAPLLEEFHQVVSWFLLNAALVKAA